MPFTYNPLYLCLHITENQNMASKEACGTSPSAPYACFHEPIPKEEAWKHRPPYQIQSPEEFGPVKWHGKCHCGQITYSLSREKPLNAKFCHCRGCQLMHGMPAP